MTSHHRRDNARSMFTTKSPHFFKVILDETIRDGKLGIPRNFVRKFGKQLPSPIHLEVPSGAVWHVELTKCDERVWMQNGWQEFAAHYSLKHGYFLVFRYEGNAHFHVLIFDKSALEIEYPYTKTEEDDDIIYNTSECKKKKENSDLPCPQPHKKMKVDSPYETPTNLKLKISAQATKAGRVTGQRSPQIEVPKRVRGLTGVEKVKALQKARGFKTKNPFFMVVMQPSFVSSQYRMGIPDNFARKYLKLTPSNVILHISSRQTWPVKYYCRQNIDRPKAQLRGAWQAFAKHNALEVGDVCVFELTEKSPEILLKVVIYPVAEEDANAARPLSEFKFTAKDKSKGMSCAQRCLKPDFLRRMQPLAPKEKERALKRASAFEYANPRFTIAMQPSYVLTAYLLHIPDQFANRYLKKNGEVTLRVSDGRTWMVDYYRRVFGPRTKSEFRGSGWRAFVADNNLKVGDVCVFDLIKANGILLDVVIISAADSASCSSSNLEEAEDDGSIEILEDSTAPCKKASEKSPIHCPRPQKMMKTNVTNRTEKILKSEYVAPRFRPYGNKASRIKLE